MPRLFADGLFRLLTFRTQQLAGNEKLAAGVSIFGGFSATPPEKWYDVLH